MFLHYRGIGVFWPKIPLNLTLGASRRLRGKRYIKARSILGHILTLSDPKTGVFFRPSEVRFRGILGQNTPFERLIFKCKNKKNRVFSKIANQKWLLYYVHPAYIQLVAKCASPSICPARAMGWTRQGNDWTWVQLRS